MAHDQIDPRGMGVPYAKEYESPSGGTRMICPGCGEEILLLEMKDDESFTGVEYQVHYTLAAAAEANKPSPPMRMRDLNLYMIAKHIDQIVEALYNDPT
jgi:hypothetical protein